MLSGVVFDFDGVIVDTERLHYRAFQEVLGPSGLGYSWEDYLATYIGFDDRDAFQAAFSRAGLGLDPAVLEGLIASKAEAFGRLAGGGAVEPFPGAIRLINSLYGEVPMALCSGALRGDMLPILERLDLLSRFALVVAAEDVSRGKPAPDGYERALDGLRAEFPGRISNAGHVLAVEDTPHGIEAAHGAGLRALGVATSYPRERLRAADWVVPTLESVDAGLLRQWMRYGP